jgi:transposase-like protein
VATAAIPCKASKGYWIASKRRYDCAECGHASYLTAGTLMHRSHMPLMTWFHGAFLVGALTPGISAVQFQRQMGLTRYETAFQILHKLRHGMVNPERGKLKGTVEVDETYVGGLREGSRGGRTIDYKVVVIGAVEVHHAKKTGNEYAGRIRFRVIPNANANNLLGFIRGHIEKGSRVVTDGYNAYARVGASGYTHEPIILGESHAGAEWLRLIHLEISNLKTYLRGTYHGRVEKQHLQAYLNEFCFRHNRRHYEPGFGFLRMLELGSHRRSPTYNQLYSTDEFGRDVHMNGLGLPPEQPKLPANWTTRRFKRLKGRVGRL